MPRNAGAWETGLPWERLPQLPYLPAPLPPGTLVGDAEGGTSTHPLVVHVGQGPCHQLNQEDHQQQTEVLGARRKDGHHWDWGWGGRWHFSTLMKNVFLKQ